MEWEHPAILLLALPLLILLYWVSRSSLHPMRPARARLLLLVRSLSCILVLLALASPLLRISDSGQTAIFVLDQSTSMGPQGRDAVLESYHALRSQLPRSASIGVVTAAGSPEILRLPGDGNSERGLDFSLSRDRSTDLGSALRLASSLFPPQTSAHVILISDGLETTGDLEAAAQLAALKGVRVHTLPVAGSAQPDVRISNFFTSQTRLRQGATLGLTASVEASAEGTAVIRLFENGIEIERRNVNLEPGIVQELEFRRTPPGRNLFSYRVAVESFSAEDALPANNEALAVVDVMGPPLILYLEGASSQSRYLRDAMEREDIVLQVRPPASLPTSPNQLAAYDAIIVSDLEASQLKEAGMSAIRSYVEELGGGFLMIGGPNAFGPGGYFRTPLEEVLPVRLHGKDHEEDPTSALTLVIDRSGSMAGEKLEICKTASIATAELLQEDDFIGVYAFDSSVHPVLPLARVGSSSEINRQLSQLSAGGGTNIYPAMIAARTALNNVEAKIKHMIVLTDGQTLGQGYQSLAANCQAEGITISTVAVGDGAQIPLLQGIAAAGGGKSYVTMDPSTITRIFTQDTVLHTRKLVREDPFQPLLTEAHPMVGDWEDAGCPPLLGYVKTERKTSAQAILSTEDGDPILAHWRFGHGKVTAFTSDCKARWATLWLSGWDGYSRLWSQIIRETMRPTPNRNLDLQIETREDQVWIQADLLADAGTRINEASVTADLFFVLDNALSSNLRKTQTVQLRQTGPGLYAASFRPDEPGIYLVRAQAGSQTVTASHVHRPPMETASGLTNANLLKSISEATGGSALASTGDSLQLTGSTLVRSIPVWPWLIYLLLPLLLLDVTIRRWETVLTIFQLARRQPA